MDNIDLSIYVETYNHEKYIKGALDSIFKQETSYSYEVLVGEDCSTDKTKDVLKQYEKEHEEYVVSGKLKILYRQHNMYKEIPNNEEDLVKRCRGKYIIALEGDDYWIDNKKIDKQIRFLENHQEYIGVAHNCVVIDEFGKIKDENYPECKQEEYTIKHYMSNIFPGQTATLMYRNIYNNPKIKVSLLEKGLCPSDSLIVLVLMCYGKIYCMQEYMSAYRHVASHGDSFSANYKYNFRDDEKWHKEIVIYLNETNSIMLKYGESLYFRCIMKGIKRKQCTFKQGLEYLKVLKHKLYVLWKWCIYKIRKDILHKEIWI